MTLKHEQHISVGGHLEIEDCNAGFGPSSIPVLDAVRGFFTSTAHGILWERSLQWCQRLHDRRQLAAMR